MAAGVDTFVRERRSLFLFFQGHPEYDADTLPREYRRDVARFLRGERDSYPDLPKEYFDPITTDMLNAFRA
jgi:homoserine O-succinyltransferase